MLTSCPYLKALMKKSDGGGSRFDLLCSFLLLPAKTGGSDHGKYNTCCNAQFFTTIYSTQDYFTANQILHHFIHFTFPLRIRWNTCRCQQQAKRWNLNAKLYTYSLSVFKWTGFKCTHISIFWSRSSACEVPKSDGWEAPACFFDETGLGESTAAWWIYRDGKCYYPPAEADFIQTVWFFSSW